MVEGTLHMSVISSGVPPSTSLFAPESLADPYAIYWEGLRHGGLQTVRGYPGTWAAFSYADCTTLLRDPRLLQRRSDFVVANFPPEQHAEFAELMRHLGQFIMFLNNPQHARLRKLMNKGFTPTIVESWRPRIAAVVDRLLEPISAQSEVDLMRSVAYPLPVHVITTMLGIPSEMNKQFGGWSEAILNAIGNPDRSLEQARSAYRSILDFNDYFAKVVAERRHNKGDDLISLLISIEEAGDVLTEEEIYAQCIFLLLAGYETTRNLIGNGMYTLLKNPHALDELRANPDLIRSAVEELLRYESPLQMFSRTASEIITHGGVKVLEGEAIMFVVAAANRDPKRFENPDQVNIKRADNQHLAFGHGHHFCMGMQLARLEAQTAIRSLLERFPKMQLRDSLPDWQPNFALRGLRSLPIKV
jgi:cytochrome P450